MLSHPHYVRDYRRMVRRLRDKLGYEEAMQRAVGGSYSAVGTAQAALLKSAGLRDGDTIVDIGCGSGRTAFALRDLPALRYYGFDVVPELCQYAARHVNRPDWVFSPVDGTAIPLNDGVADFVILFSVITHLTRKEAAASLAEAVRVLKPGGRIVVSFLDTKCPRARAMSGGWLRQTVQRIRGFGVKNVVTDRTDIAVTAEAAGLSVQFHGPERIGQSYCVFTRMD